MNKTNPFLEHALLYAAIGWRVMPISRKNKIPCIKRWQEKASLNTEIIQEWWDKWPRSNIGIATGIGSNLVVLDIDHNKDGEKTLETLIKKHGKLPRTLESITGGGGRHLLFSHPNVNIRNSVNKLGQGLDIRSDGGFIITPPSIHPTGTTYAWKDPSLLLFLPPAPLPDWMISLLKYEVKDIFPVTIKPIQGPEVQQRGEYWLKWALAKVANGRGRNDTVLHLTRMLLNNSISKEDAERFLRLYVSNIPKRDHPYTMDEALRILDYVYSNP